MSRETYEILSEIPQSNEEQRTIDTRALVSYVKWDHVPLTKEGREYHKKKYPECKVCALLIRMGEVDLKEIK